MVLMKKIYQMLSILMVGMVLLVTQLAQGAGAQTVEDPCDRRMRLLKLSDDYARSHGLQIGAPYCTPWPYGTKWPYGGGIFEDPLCIKYGADLLAAEIACAAKGGVNLIVGGFNLAAKSAEFAAQAPVVLLEATKLRIALDNSIPLLLDHTKKTAIPDGEALRAFVTSNIVTPAASLSSSADPVTAVIGIAQSACEAVPLVFKVLADMKLYVDFAKGLMARQGKNEDSIVGKLVPPISKVARPLAKFTNEAGTQGLLGGLLKLILPKFGLQEEYIPFLMEFIASGHVDKTFDALDRAIPRLSQMIGIVDRGYNLLMRMQPVAERIAREVYHGLVVLKLSTVRLAPVLGSGKQLLSELQSRVAQSLKLMPDKKAPIDLQVIAKYLDFIRSFDLIIKPIIQIVREALVALKPVQGAMPSSEDIEKIKARASVLYPVSGRPTGHDLVNALGGTIATVMQQMGQPLVLSADFESVAQKITEFLGNTQLADMFLKPFGLKSGELLKKMEGVVKTLTEKALSAKGVKERAEYVRAETERLAVPAKAAGVFSDRELAKQVQEVLNRLDKALHQLEVIERFNTKLQGVAPHNILGEKAPKKPDTRLMGLLPKFQKAIAPLLEA